MKLEINYRKKSEKRANMWRLKNMLLKKQQSMMKSSKKSENEILKTKSLRNSIEKLLSLRNINNSNKIPGRLKMEVQTLWKDVKEDIIKGRNMSC